MLHKLLYNKKRSGKDKQTKILKIVVGLSALMIRLELFETDVIFE